MTSGRPRVASGGMLTVSAQEVPDKIAHGWTLLDVRTRGEWAQGRIEGSTHIPMDEVMARLAEIGDGVVCVCAVGARSAAVAEYLQAQGRTAANLDGGLQAWVSSGGRLVR